MTIHLKDIVFFKQKAFFHAKDAYPVGICFEIIFFLAVKKYNIFNFDRHIRCQELCSGNPGSSIRDIDDENAENPADVERYIDQAVLFVHGQPMKDGLIAST